MFNFFDMTDMSLFVIIYWSKTFALHVSLKQFPERNVISADDLEKDEIIKNMIRCMRNKCVKMAFTAALGDIIVGDMLEFKLNISSP